MYFKSANVMLSIKTCNSLVSIMKYPFKLLINCIHGKYKPITRLIIPNLNFGRRYISIIKMINKNFIRSHVK